MYGFSLRCGGTDLYLCCFGVCVWVCVYVCESFEPILSNKIYSYVSQAKTHSMPELIRNIDSVSAAVASHGRHRPWKIDHWIFRCECQQHNGRSSPSGRTSYLKSLKISISLFQDSSSKFITPSAVTLASIGFRLKRNTFYCQRYKQNEWSAVLNDANQHQQQLWPSICWTKWRKITWEFEFITNNKTDNK